MQLREEWNKILKESRCLYIYGAGKIGKKIYTLIKKDNQLHKLKAFVVSDFKVANPDYIDDKQVIGVEDLKDKNATVLVSVSDIYQNEIIEQLQKLEFTHIVCAYKFSFLDEEETPQEMPKSLMIDLRELLIQQYSKLDFNRYDIVVRLLAIEDYFGENDFGFDLYRKMQDNRVRPGYAKTAVIRFQELIKSIKEYGYDENSEIIVDCNLRLIDGAHRVALAIYHNISKVKIRILKKSSDIDYGLKWFEQCFNSEECNLIAEQLEELSKRWFFPIKGILWPTVAPYFQEITELISNQYAVMNIADYELPKEVFQRFVYGVYHIDDIAEWKVLSKLKYFGEKDFYCIRMFDIHMRHPDFRVKKSGSTISRNGEKLKKIIRDKYKNRIEYFPDIIFHTGDNFFQSEYLDALVKRVFSLRELFEKIYDLDWMLIKTENYYFPKDFPDAYPMYKDIDMICRREDAKEILERISSFYNKYVNDLYDIKIIIEEEKGFKCRFELKGFLIFMVEVFYAHDLLQETFLRNSLSMRIKKDGYYVCSNKDELIYRMMEVYKYPNKRKHLMFIKDNLEKLAE